MEKIVVLGASPNPWRFSHKVVKSLLRRQYDVVAVGYRAGSIEGLEILTGKPEIENVHTILLYIGVEHQSEYYDYIVNLHPKRIIFNPGTENEELKKLAEEKGIETKNDCALLMLGSDFL